MLQQGTIVRCLALSKHWGGWGEAAISATASTSTSTSF